MTTKRTVSRPFHLKAWRKSKMISPSDLADALNIKRESYHRLETNWPSISVSDIDVLADKVGIEPGQFWMSPDDIHRVNADALLRDQPQEIIDLALRLIAAITAVPSRERNADEDWLVKFFGDRSEDEVKRMKKMLEAAFPPKLKSD